MTAALCSRNALLSRTIGRIWQAVLLSPTPTAPQRYAAALDHSRPSLLGFSGHSQWQKLQKRLNISCSKYSGPMSSTGPVSSAAVGGTAFGVGLPAKVAPKAAKPAPDRSFPSEPRVGIGAVVLRRATPPATGKEVGACSDDAVPMHHHLSHPREAQKRQTTVWLLAEGLCAVINRNPLASIYRMQEGFASASNACLARCLGYDGAASGSSCPT